jgi:hypothetical protein
MAQVGLNASGLVLGAAAAWLVQTQNSNTARAEHRLTD